MQNTPLYARADARSASACATVPKRLAAAILSLLVMLVLATGAIGATAIAAFADATVALTVVDLTDNNHVVANRVATVPDGSTVADVLTAAGFTAGTQEQSAADSMVYFESYGAPYFLGKGYDPATWTYWVSGSSNDDAPYGYLTDVVVDGAYYQYIYGGITDPTTWRLTWTYTDAVSNPLATYRQQQISAQVRKLEANLFARFSRGSADAALYSGTDYAAYAMNTLSLGAAIDTDGIIANLSKEDSLGTGRAARYMLMLQSAHMTNEAIAKAFGSTGVDDAAAYLVNYLSSAHDASVYDLVYILPALENLGADQAAKDEAIANILVTQTDDGLFGGQYADNQTSAQAVLALAPYYDTNTTVKTAVDKCLAALAATQNADGGYPYSVAYGTDSDADTTAAVIVAYAALGTTPVQLASLTGYTPLTYLMTRANEDLTGITGTYSEVMSAATVYMALAAAEDMQKTGKSVNVLNANAHKARSFTDVTDPQQWYYLSVYRALDCGLMSGYSTSDVREKDDRWDYCRSGTFGPADTLTRAQAAAILWNYYEPEASAAYDETGRTGELTEATRAMGDVAAHDWYTAAANWAVANGVVSGVENKDGTRTFDPEGCITREQLCAIVANAAQQFDGAAISGGEDQLAAMPDASQVHDWATSSVAWGLNKGVINGRLSDMGERSIAPRDEVTRAEMAAIMMNALDGNVL